MASIKLKGDVSGEVTISAPSVAGTTTLELPATSSTLATQNSLGVRNLIINGDMRIAQRGTSVTGVTTNGYRTVDRFYHSIVNGGTWTITQDTDVPTGQGFTSSLKMDCTTADTSLSTTDQAAIGHQIEAQNLQHLKFGTSSAESITLSFWIKSNKTGTYPLWFQEPDATKHASKLYTIDTADTWEKKTITIAGDTAGQIDNNNGTGITIQWGFASGSTYTSGTSTDGAWETQTLGNIYAGLTVNLADSTSNYINLTGVQLEVGTEATPFEHRPYDMELARCQRYFYQQTLTDNLETICVSACYGNTATFGVFRFPVQMRIAPTGSISDVADFAVFEAGNGFAVTAFACQEQSTITAQLNFSSTNNQTSGNAAWVRGNSITPDGSQWIRFDSEL